MRLIGSHIHAFEQYHPPTLPQDMDMEIQKAG